MGTGVEVGLHGRSLVATGRSYGAGDRVLLETPALVGLEGDEGLELMFIDFETKFGDTETTRRTVLDLYCPPSGLASSCQVCCDNGACSVFCACSSVPRVVSRQALASKMAAASPSQWPAERQALFVEFVLVCDYNSHCLAGNVPQKFVLEDLAAQALFLRGSMGNHSCRPNTSFSTDSGCLELTAVRPIADGEEITYSYVQIMGQCTEERRAELLDTKGFLCTCPKCLEPDWDRGLRHCTASGVLCEGTVLLYPSLGGDGDGDGPADWRCTRCGTVPAKKGKGKGKGKERGNGGFDKSLEAEAALRSRLGELRRATLADLQLPVLEVELQSEDLTLLAPHHSLAVDLVRLLSTAAQSWCTELQDHNRYPRDDDDAFLAHPQVVALVGAVGSFPALCWQSGRAGARAASLFDCASAHCPCPGRAGSASACTARHEPSTHSTHEAFYALLELEKCLCWGGAGLTTRQWMHYTAAREPTVYARAARLLMLLLDQYGAHLAVVFGPEDEDVLRLVSLADEAAPLLARLGYCKPPHDSVMAATQHGPCSMFAPAQRS